MGRPRGLGTKVSSSLGGGEGCGGCGVGLRRGVEDVNWRVGWKRARVSQRRHGGGRLRMVRAKWRVIRGWSIVVVVWGLEWLSGWKMQWSFVVSVAAWLRGMSWLCGHFRTH